MSDLQLMPVPAKPPGHPPTPPGAVATEAADDNQAELGRLVARVLAPGQRLAGILTPTIRLYR